MDSGLRRNDGGYWPANPTNTLTPTPNPPTTAPSPGERFVTLERKAAAFDPLNLIRLTPA